MLSRSAPARTATGAALLVLVTTTRVAMAEEPRPIDAPSVVPRPVVTERPTATGTSAAEERSKAARQYAISTTWLLVALGSGAGAVAWVMYEPIENTTGVALPATILGGMSALSLAWSFDAYGKAAAHSRAAEMLRQRASVKWRVTPTLGGASFTLSGSF